VAQQELRQSVAGAHQIAADVLARSDQVAQRLLSLAGHPHRMQLAGQQQPHQVFGHRVESVFIRSPAARGILPGRGNHAVDPALGELTGKPIAGGPGLIANAHW
jgi:hypothetical protein